MLILDFGIRITDKYIEDQLFSQTVGHKVQNPNSKIQIVNNFVTPEHGCKFILLMTPINYP